MTLKIARRGTVPPFIVMDVMRAANERAAAGGDVLHLEVGQPSTGAPAGVVAAVQAVLGQEALGYTDALGLPPLRRRIARHYSEWYGVTVDPDRVVVTTGSSGGFLLAFLACFEPGDRVVLTDPSYPCYRNILKALGVETVHIPVGPETRFQPSPALLDRVDGRIDGLVVASPSNPTGSMIRPDELRALTTYCGDRGIRLISDEIYHGITYEEPAVTALSLGGEAVVVNSFSKYFSMTGWRLGWMVAPEALVTPVERLAQNLFISAPTLSQHGGIAAFDCHEELRANVARYAENRSLLLRELPKAGLDRLAPSDGAFYVYADVSHLTNDSGEFCRRLLAETGVAATPGIDFDTGRGSGTLRFSFAGSTEEVGEAAARLQRWLRA